MMRDYLKFTQDLSKLVAINSVKDKPKKNMPFGENVFRAFETFMGLARNMGFKTVNYNNYIGEIDYGDEGEEVGIIGHIDIVPAGTGWNTDPFTLTEKDGKLIGRGVLDDKSPLLMCLYALNELKSCVDAKGLKTKKRFRLFVGCDEETAWEDIDYFKRNHKFPKYGFSPDGNFPVIYAEKGMLHATFSIPKLKNFYDVSGGTVFNAVCGRCTVKPKGKIDYEKIKKHGLNVLSDGTIESLGVSCHGSMPEKGKNAIKPLFEYFLDEGEDVKNFLDCLFYDKFNLSRLKNEQGKLTFSPDIIFEDDDKISVLCDCRIPAPISVQEVLKIFDRFNITYTYKVHRGPLMVDKNDDFVQTLLKSYNRVTGENVKPKSMGGGTFAYVFEKGCAFGPEFDEEDSCCHEPNEYIEIEKLKKMYEIYKTTIFSLAGI